ncbi:MAG: hypothetical protein RLZZ546_801, partial [Bacteroidota bacterium]|jgi:hypothetical protein
MGFGSGLNALMAIIYCNLHNCVASYTGIESLPVSSDVYKKLNYTEIINKPQFYDVFINMHSCAWGQKVKFFDNFTFQKINQKIEESDICETFDVIFYDAFAPSCQPHLWEENIMQKMYNMLKPGGVLVTYCAKGEFKRVLKRVGFYVESLVGPARKREITRAIKYKLID